MADKRKKIKIKKLAILDMVKFLTQAKTRDKYIEAAPAKEIKADYKINKNAKNLHPDYQGLIVSEIIDHGAAGAKTFVFTRAGGAPVAYFRAGQYLSLKLQIGNSFVTRPYSISSSPKWALEGKIAITVKANPNGFAADWLLTNLKVGDKVLASGGEGQFYYDALRDEKNVVALAGGSGITPFLSMAYAIRDGIEDFNLTIIFGSRNEESILFKNELDKLTAECPEKIKVVHVLSEEEKDGYEYGFITANIIAKYARVPCSIFICGPEQMYRFLENEISLLNLPKKNVRRELLGVTKKVWELPDYPIEVKYQTFNLTVKQGPNEYKMKARADEPLLVAIERAGIKAPSKCRSGECGWCRSRIVSGSVYVPSENEGRRYADIEYCYIHPCASFPVTDIVLEVPGEYYM